MGKVVEMNLEQWLREVKELGGMFSLEETNQPRRNLMKTMIAIAEKVTPDFEPRVVIHGHCLVKITDYDKQKNLFRCMGNGNVGDRWVSCDEVKDLANFGEAYDLLDEMLHRKKRGVTEQVYISKEKDGRGK